MRQTLLALVVLLLPTTATTKEKIDPSNYTLTVVVGTSTGVKETIRTGDIPTTSDPRCNHPAPVRPNGSPMPLPYVCGGAKTLPVYATFLKFEATVGETVYTLRGKTPPPPNTYKARIIPGPHATQDMEFLLLDDKGNSKAAKFAIISKVRVAKP